MSIISRLWNQDFSSSSTSLHASPTGRIDAGSQNSTTVPKAPLQKSFAPSSPPSSKTIEKSTHSLLALNRYEFDIQRRFQTLLDIQAERLLSLTVDQHSGSRSASDVGSRSPRSNLASDRGKVTPVRQPTPQHLSLRATRREIGSALQELSAVKEEEWRLYKIEIQKREETASRIEAWEHQRQGLHEEIQNIHASDRQQHMQNLQDENNVLQEQINALENQLMELKSQQNAVKLELTRLENSTQSQLSSYTQSLRILETEIQRFLSQPPSTIPDLHPKETNYGSLPSSRRTLKLALDDTQEDIQALTERLKTSQEESEATREGQVVWRDVVLSVTELEQHMRKVLVRGSGDGDFASSFGGLLDEIDRAITDLDSKMKLSDARGWKLLVCCIGAELEALQKGRTIMAEAVSEDGAEKASETFELPNSPHEASHYKGTRKQLVPSSSELDRGQNIEVPLDSAPIAALDQQARRTESTSQQVIDPASGSPSGRSSGEIARRTLQMRKDDNRSPPSDSARHAGSGGDATIRRSIDSFRRRNDRNPTKTYRPEDDEPGLDLLITDPNPID